MASTTELGLQMLEPRRLLSGDLPSHTFQPDDGGVPSIVGIKSGANYTIANGGFETFTPSDLQGWKIAGNAASVITDYYTAPEGISQALVTNGPGINGPGSASPLAGADLETLLGLSKGTLTKKGVVNGSVITQTFKAAPLELVTFQANFLSNENGKSDFAFITVNNGRDTKLYKITDLLHPASVAAAGTQMINETGYGRYTILLAKGGTYTIGFGVTNVASTSGLSTLLVDNVQLIPLLPFDLHWKDLFGGDDGKGFKPNCFN